MKLTVVQLFMFFFLFPFLNSGVIGSGVCCFSKYPIQDVMFHRWSLNGYVHKVHHGDWFGGKGVGLCRLRVDDANVNIYNAHVSLSIIHNSKKKKNNNNQLFS